MRKEFEVKGCMKVTSEVTQDEFIDSLTEFAESKGWSFYGWVHEIQDGFYINLDGTRGKSVLDEECD